MAKYIFDFDDVFFFNPARFKPHMYSCFADIGVPHEVVQKYYQKERDKGFVLAHLVASILRGEHIESITPAELTEKILSACKNFVNHDLIARIKKLGAENCYLVTHGVREYQLEKINRTGIGPLFAQISVVQDTKKRFVESICGQFKDDKVIFVDDKEKRFADLDFKKYPNLKNVLYVGSQSIPIIFEHNEHR